MAAKALSEDQLSQMRELIEQWRASHPHQYYVANVRFSDFESFPTAKSTTGLKLPTNLLGLLYLDPLAGLDPVAAELKSYRDLTERVLFAVVRMPQYLGARWTSRYGMLCTILRWWVSFRARPGYQTQAAAWWTRCPIFPRICRRQATMPSIMHFGLC